MTFLLGSEPFIGRLKNQKIHAFHSYWHTEYGTDDVFTASQMAPMLDYAERKDRIMQEFTAKSKALMQMHKDNTSKHAEALLSLVREFLAIKAAVILPPMPPSDLFFAQGGVVKQRPEFVGGIRVPFGSGTQCPEYKVGDALNLGTLPNASVNVIIENLSKWSNREEFKLPEKFTDKEAEEISLKIRPKIHDQNPETD